jgi:hypothetical protein
LILSGAVNTSIIGSNGVLNRVSEDGLLFGEFTGSVLLEMPGDTNLDEVLAGIPHQVIGKVIAESDLVLTEEGKILWQEPISGLAERWAETLREVVE